MKRKLFEYLAALSLIAVAVGLCCCAPSQQPGKQNVVAGTYLASPDRPYAGDEGDFDIRKTVVYPEIIASTFSSELNVSNKQLTTYRCTWCHECTFPQVWDIDNVGKPGWKPGHVGDAWKPIVQRMRNMDGSMLNEEIADRIYSYLLQESTGTYDPTKDTNGATVVHVDNPNGPQTVESPSAAAKHRDEEQKKAEGGQTPARPAPAPPASGSGSGAGGTGMTK